MSRLSPYRKNTTSYNPDYAPSPNYKENTVMYDKSKIIKQNPMDYTNKRYLNTNDESHYRLTEKKKYDQISNINNENLHKRNSDLTRQNQELYILLEERGKIITALEKKLEEQMRRQLSTFDVIEAEKSKFINEYQKKLKEYEHKIQELIYQNYGANQHNLLNRHATVREMSEIEKCRMINLIQSKNNEISQLNLEFQGYTDKLKNEIISLENEVVHLNHMRKIELSEQKIMYENMIQGLSRDYQKERDVANMHHQIEMKKLENLLASKHTEANKLGQQKKITEIQRDVREQELIQKRSKLQIEIRQIEQFHKKSAFDETQRLKQLNEDEIKVLSFGNESIISNLKCQNAHLINLVKVKSQQIEKLRNEMANNRTQFRQEKDNIQSLVEQLKEKIRQMQNDYQLQEQAFKVKYSELRQADITALKQFYEHEIQILEQNNYEKNQEAANNRALLHQQLHEKNQMRKQFDLQILKLNSRIFELQLKLKQLSLLNSQQKQVVNGNMNMTSQLLVRESKDRLKLTQANEQEKRKLQTLITAKDQQIQQLNKKIEFIKENHEKEIQHKIQELDFIKRAKQTIEVELKKQKYFYDNEIKKKEYSIKNNKQIYETEIQRLKSAYNKQYEQSMKNISQQKNQLQIEVNRFRAIEKTLKNQMGQINTSKTQEIVIKQNQLSSEKYKYEEERKNNEQNLKKYYTDEIKSLNIEVQNLQKQLNYKQEDLRNLNIKYHRLEEKLEMVIESQQKLKNMENKIIAMGQENNIVKNLADLIKSRKK